MLLSVSFLSTILVAAVNAAADRSRTPLSYAALPDNTYVAPKNTSGSSILDLIKSRSELSSLAALLEEPAGFKEAFATNATWTSTFFAPSNEAFNHTGSYFTTFRASPKGKWWLGNLLQHHYVPFSKLHTTAFNTSYTRFQTSSYLYVGAQVVNGELLLNNVAHVTEGDIPVNNGIVHIIDRILDPSALIFEADVAKTSQGFIAGSCSNPLLAYC